MNWETAKTWLISIFLLLDILLGWMWLQSRNTMQGYVESESDLLANTKTLLAEHGLALETSVPSNSPDMASLHASYPNVSMKALAKVAFPTAKVLSIDNAAQILTTNEGSVRMMSAGSWDVSYNHPIAYPKHGLMTLINRVWRSADYVPDPASDSQGTTVLVERYNGYSMYDVEVLLQTQSHVLLGYTQSLMTAITAVGAPKPVISALDALDSLAVSVDKTTNGADNRILKMDLGYLRKVPTNPFGSPTSPSNYWFPVWRVVTTNQTYYINAFSGEVES